MKNTLLLLDETERQLALEALSNYLAYSLYSHKNNPENLKILKALGSHSGGMRMEVKDTYGVCEALMWNSKFMMTSKERFEGTVVEPYSKLGGAIMSRSQNITLFGDFDPQYYNAPVKPFKKFNFEKSRLLLIRFQGEKMEFITEFYRENKESDDKYLARIHKKVEESNKECQERLVYNPAFKGMRYQAVWYADLPQHTFKKGYSYHL